MSFSKDSWVTICNRQMFDGETGVCLQVGRNGETSSQLTWRRSVQGLADPGAGPSWGTHAELNVVLNAFIYISIFIYLFHVIYLFSASEVAAWSCVCFFCSYTVKYTYTHADTDMFIHISIHIKEKRQQQTNKTKTKVPYT